MVVAVFFEQFVPSNRGLSRDGSATQVDARAWYNSSSDGNRDYRNASIRNFIEATPSTPVSTPVTRLKLKQFRASKLLASLAADIDVVTDWIFFFHTLSNDKEYRAEFALNPVEGSAPYLIPPMLLSILLTVCILGTMMWLVLATDGAVITPLLRLLHVDKLSMGYALFLCVLIEDIPQVILAFIVEDYYGENHEFNNFALASVIASIYDTFIKLAEAFDERADVVETGVWCKESLWAHKQTVTAVITLPLPEQKLDNSLSNSNSSRMHIPIQRRAQRGSMIEEVREIVADTKLPRLRFLSTSMDKTIRLWDSSAQVPGHKREKCTRCIRGHVKGVTCVVFLGEITRDRQTNPEEDIESNMYFLTGSHDGRTKLWNLKGKCFRNYFRTGENESTVTSVAYVNRDTSFACGYRSGIVRLWEIWSGVCLAEYRGHDQMINAVCSLEDSYSVLSASNDDSIRLWDTTTAVAHLAPRGQRDNNLPSPSGECFTLITDKAVCTEKVSSKTFIGHNGPVLSLACVDPGFAFLSGSQDATARLWSIESGSCLRVFAGHSGPVTTVAAVDPVTILTGSKDTTIKVWDTFSAVCIRTYTGHTSGVTSVSTAHNGTFISASEDRTIKLWVFTAVPPPIQSEKTVHGILGVNDNTCMT
jgi:WD40 repeat protein